MLSDAANAVLARPPIVTDGKTPSSSPPTKIDLLRARAESTKSILIQHFERLEEEGDALSASEKSIKRDRAFNTSPLHIQNAKAYRQLEQENQILRQELGRIQSERNEFLDDEASDWKPRFSLPTCQETSEQSSESFFAPKADIENDPRVSNISKKSEVSVQDLKNKVKTLQHEKRELASKGSAAAEHLKEEMELLVRREKEYQDTIFVLKAEVVRLNLHLELKAEQVSDIQKIEEEPTSACENEYEEEIATLKAEIGQLRQILASQSTEKGEEKDLDEIQEEHQKEVSELQTKLDQLNHDLQSEREKSILSEEKVSVAACEVEKRDQEISTLKEKIGQLNLDVGLGQEVQQEFREMAIALSLEKDNLKKEISSLQEEVGRLNLGLQDDQKKQCLESADEKNKRDIKPASGKDSSCKGCYDDIIYEYNESIWGSEKASGASIDKTQLQDEIMTLKAKVAHLDQQLEVEQETVREGTLSRKELQKDIEDLKVQVGQLQQELKLEKEKHQSLLETEARSRKQYEDEIIGSKAKIGQLQRQLELDQEMQKALEEKAATLHREKEEYQQEKTTWLSLALDSEDNKKQDLAETDQDMADQSDLEFLSKEKNVSVQQIVSATEKLEYEEEIAELKDEVSRLNHELQTMYICQECEESPQMFGPTVSNESTYCSGCYDDIYESEDTGYCVGCNADFDSESTGEDSTFDEIETSCDDWVTTGPIELNLTISALEAEVLNAQDQLLSALEEIKQNESILEEKEKETDSLKKQNGTLSTQLALLQWELDFIKSSDDKYTESKVLNFDPAVSIEDSNETKSEESAENPAIQCEETKTEAVNEPRARKPCSVGMQNEKVCSEVEVRITNEASGRFKDLALPITNDSTVYDAVYNSSSVKWAYVRKWPSEIVEGVKNKTLEIKCILQGDDGSILHIFSIDDLKRTSMKGLCDIPQRSQGRLKLVLQCHKTGKVHEETLSELTFRISNETTRRYKQLVVGVSKDLTLYDAVYDSRPVKAAKVRSWPTESVQALKDKTSQVECVLVDNTGDAIQVFTLNELRTVSTKDILSLLSKPIEVVKLVLRCKKIETLNVRESQSEKTNLHFKPSGFRHRGWFPVEDTSSVFMQVSIRNESTDRFKDLVVPVSKDLTMFDGIYDHKSVKTANVRKFSGRTAQAVKNNTAKIQCMVSHNMRDLTLNNDLDDGLFDDEGNVVHTFSVDDLKETSTEAFFDLLSRPKGLVKVFLRCQAIESSVSIPEAEVFEMQEALRRATEEASLKAQLLAEKENELSESMKQTETISAQLAKLQAEVQSLSLYSPSNVMRSDVHINHLDTIKESNSNDEGDYIELTHLNTIEESNSKDEEDSPKISPFGFAQRLKFFALGTPVSESQTETKSSAKQDEPKYSVNFKPIGFRQRGWLSGESSWMDMRLRINNEKEFEKDLVVEISPETTLYDAVYKNQALQEVVDNASKIDFVVWHDMGNEVQSFSIGDLKELTTQKFFELTSRRQDLLKVVLRCQEKAGEQVRELELKAEAATSMNEDLEVSLDTLRKDSEKKEMSLNAVREEAEMKETDLQMSLDALRDEMERKETSLGAELAMSLRKQTSLETELDASVQKRIHLQTDLASSTQRQANLEVELDLSKEELALTVEKHNSLEKKLDALLYERLEL